MLTLEISSTDIRLMEVDRGKVIRWASQLLEPGIIEDEEVVDPQALGRAISRLISSTGVKGNSVVASVSGLYSLSRIVMVSVPPGGVVAHQAVVDAANEVMPLSEDEMYLSWQSTGATEGGHQVLVVSVPRDVIDGQMRGLRIAGASAHMLELKAMAVIRAVNRAQALIVNIESSSYDIIMVVNGLVEIMRTTAWKPDELSLEEKVDQLTLNLELTVGFYNSHHQEYLLDSDTPLFITGQMSGDIDLVELLQQRAGYNVESLAPPLEYPPNLPVSQYAVNIGLALKGTVHLIQERERGAYSLPDINLLPAEYKPWRPSARQIYATLAVVAVIALLFPLYQITTAAMDKTSKLEAEFGSLNSLLELRKAELAKREPLQKAISSYEALVDVKENATGDLAFIISQAESLDVEILTIVHQVNSLSVNCQTNSYITFRDFVTALENSGLFTTPITPPEGYPYIKSGTIKLTPVPAE